MDCISEREKRQSAGIRPATHRAEAYTQVCAFLMPAFFGPADRRVTCQLIGTNQRRLKTQAIQNRRKEGKV